MSKATSRIKLELLAWLAFCVVCAAFWGSFYAVAVMRATTPTEAARAAMTLSGSVMVVGIVLGLVARDYVRIRLAGAGRDENVELKGCFYLTIPASLLAFFCTCAPIGLIAATEDTVRINEKNWSIELLALACILGLLAAFTVARRIQGKHKQKNRKHS